MGTFVYTAVEGSGKTVRGRMEGESQPAVLAKLRARYPQVQVVALTSFVEEEKAQAALDAGASGFLLKDADAGEVAAAIRAAYRGEVHLDPAIAGRLIRALRTPSTPQPRSALTERDLLSVAAKSIIPGFLAGAICCSEGLSVEGSATEIPQAVSRGVQRSVVAMFFVSVVVSVVSYR